MLERVMNEVMTLSEDEGLNIWYHDTESMHIVMKKYILLLMGLPRPLSSWALD